VKPRERRLLLLLGAVALLSFRPVWRYFQQGPATVSGRRAEKLPEALPRIDLDRLPRERPESQAGRRDIFAFGPPPTLPAPPRTGATPAPGPPPGSVIAESAPVAPTAPSAPRLPPMNLKYIGSVENGRGTRVAVLLTERNELLTGQAGEVVANRYKIAKIGFESVDLEEVGTGQVKRIPLRD